MSVLYNRLKNAEQDKKPDTPTDQEFPIDGEIKRQKEEQHRKTKWGIAGGMVAFLLVLSIGVITLTFNKIKSSTKKPVSSRRALVKNPTPVTTPTQVDSTTITTTTAADTTIGSASEEPAPSQTEAASPPNTQPKSSAPPAAPLVLSGELFTQGVQLYKENKYTEAVEAYMKGLQYNPQQAVGYNNLGVIQYKQGNLRKSVAQLKLAVELSPQYAEAHYNLAVVLEQLGEEKEALMHYLKFLKFATPNYQALQEKVQAHVGYYY